MLMSYRANDLMMCSNAAVMMLYIEDRVTGVLQYQTVATCYLMRNGHC